MLSIRKVLFPTDFTDCAEPAFRVAVDLARQAGAEVHVLNVAEASGEVAADGRPAVTELPFAEAAMAGLLGLDHAAWEATVERARAAGVLFRFVRTPGAAAPAVLAYARREAVDLIVLGTHGRRGLRHLVMGSVAEAILGGAACPVLSVRCHTAASAAAFRRLLVPIDFSRHAGPALRTARAVAGQHGAALGLLFVAEEHLVPVFSDTGLPSVVVLKTDDAIVLRAETALRHLYAATEGPEVSVTYHLRRGDPAREILAEARAQATDLIVMSTHGHTEAAGTLLGSITERVVRTAPCPVLTVPAGVSVAAPASS